MKCYNVEFGDRTLFEILRYGIINFDLQSGIYENKTQLAESET